MKIYVIPSEVCDADCRVCISRLREPHGVFIDAGELEKALDRLERIDRIEITGGGEPTLNPQIRELIEVCASKQEDVKMYTHGAHLKTVRGLERLKELCVSAAHYNPADNERLMGLNPDLNFLKEWPGRKKFSLLLQRGGIDDVGGLKNYLGWAKGFVGKVVIRQLFEESLEQFANRFISCKEIYEGLGLAGSVSKNGANLAIDGLEVEFEYRACGSDFRGVVIRPDCKIRYGWASQ